MSSAERQSPRKAIREWLLDTNNKPTAKLANVYPEQQEIEPRSRHHSRRHRRTRYPPEVVGQHEDTAGRKHQRRTESGIQQKSVSAKARPVDSQRAQPKIGLKEDSVVNSSGLGFAERLGLHAPFRTFKDHSNHDISEVQHRPRKRRHSRSSTSSYLEPAAASDVSDTASGHPGHGTMQRAAHSGPALGSRGKHNSPTAYQGLELLPSPEKVFKSYERRARRKTREDHYELKGVDRDSGKTKKAARKDRVVKEQKKHKRKEKTGATLMHDFTAENVAHDRLTMKPAKTLGLFGKGRASSPVRRRGLPDLAFSEMAFLASRREKPKDAFKDSSTRPSDKKKRRQSTKAADTEAEISRYFLSVDPTSLNATNSLGQKRQQDERKAPDHESPQAFVNLPNTPFLGFGSCGPNTSISPAKVSDNRRGDSPCPTRSTSYLTWSQSEAPPPPNRPHRTMRSKVSTSSDRICPSSTSHKSQRSTQSVCRARVQSTSTETDSRHENPVEVLERDHKPRLANEEGPESKEKTSNQDDTGNNKFDVANGPPQIQEPVPDKVDPAQVDKHGDPKSAIIPKGQVSRQSSGPEPQFGPQAHAARSLSTQLPVISPHKDSLDDVLDALLKDCNTKVADSNLASCATSSHPNVCHDEEALALNKIQEHSCMPTHAFVNRVSPVEASASMTNSSRRPQSATVQYASTNDGPMSTHIPSRGKVSSSHRPYQGYTLYDRAYPSISTQNQTGSTSAWTGYDTLYERQQKQAESTREASTESVLPYTTVRDNRSDPWRETNNAAVPDMYPQGFDVMDVGDKHDGPSLDFYETLQGRNEDSVNQGIGYGEWDDHLDDYGAPETIFDESYKGHDGGGLMDENNFSTYDQGELNATYERSPGQLSHQNVIRNMPDTHFTWRPHQNFGRKEDVGSCAADAQVNEVDPALADFWIPHKLY